MTSHVVNFSAFVALAGNQFYRSVNWVTQCEQDGGGWGLHVRVGPKNLGLRKDSKNGNFFLKQFLCSLRPLTMDGGAFQ